MSVGPLKYCRLIVTVPKSMPLVKVQALERPEYIYVTTSWPNTVKYRSHSNISSVIGEIRRMVDLEKKLRQGIPIAIPDSKTVPKIPLHMLWTSESQNGWRLFIRRRIMVKRLRPKSWASSKKPLESRRFLSLVQPNLLLLLAFLEFWRVLKINQRTKWFMICPDFTSIFFSLK